MIIKDLVEGLAIISRHCKEDDYVEAQHDQLFFPSTGSTILPEEILRLKKLRFFQTDGGSSRTKDLYDPDMGWSHFT